MNGTPRLSSRFPDTPQSSRRQNGTPRTGDSKSGSSLPDVTSLRNRSQIDGPLVPLDVIDAPQQRLLVVSFYGALLAWRLYDFHYLNEEETESLWAFMKWVTIDGVFLFGLPELRIPWLEWASSTMVFVFLLHACLDGILMFRIPIPLGAALGALAKLVYDRELTISERHVKYSNVVQDSNLILGRQTIKILPEGSAILNPGKDHFCLSSSRKEVYLPVQINQTTPISMTLVHFDLETNENDTVIFSASQIKKMMKEAHKNNPPSGVDGLLTIKLPARKSGLYKLGKVKDATGLEVRRRIVGDTFVVPCPRAVIKPLKHDKCRGQLSNVEFEVVGTPPLRVKYRKMINQVETLADLTGLVPENFVSPLQQESQAIVSTKRTDATWARAQSIDVPLSETLSISGKWAVSLAEVQDAFGNLVSFSQRDHENQEKQTNKAPSLHQVITVHESPTAILNGCSPQRPLKIAKDREAPLPVQLGSTGKGGMLDSQYQLEYIFTPEADLTPAGEHMAVPQTQSMSIRGTNQKPKIKQPGLYTLSAVSTEYCSGEVLEPASCLLQNPPQPSVKLETEEIFDKCAHKAIGLRVDFHLTGTPPFHIQYIMERREDGQKSFGFVDVDNLRGQRDLTPPTAGHYTYRFNEVSDETYKGFSIRDQNLVLEQDVKPSAFASFAVRTPKQMVCIDQAVKFPIALRGEGPFSVEYELVRGSQRTPYKIKDITSSTYEIETPPLSKGGDYTLSLASVTDGMGCKEFLKEEAKITVRHQKPKAGFGLVEGTRTVKTLEGKKIALPVRLTGDRPWIVEYRNLNDPENLVRTHLRDANDKIDVNEKGVYEITSMHDAICPGIVEQSASSIEVQWISRPTLSLPENAFEKVQGSTYIKHDVCEGEEDSVDLHLKGSPPFEVKYEERITPDQPKKGDRNAKALKSKSLTAALGVTSIRLDTAQAGQVEYRFTHLADSNYDHSSRHFTPSIIQQRVHARPYAKFSNPGKTYSYCTTLSSNVDSVPITLTGTPPFSIDYELKHSGKSTPRIHTVSDIKTNTYNLLVPASDLTAGTSALSLRKITDARHCTRTLPSTERVQISVHAAPSIAPLDSGKSDFCVGDRLSYALSGVSPFTIYYTFNGVARKATATTTTFRRLAEKPGTFVITAIQDAGSSCKAEVDNLRATIHGLPSARVSEGRDAESDIHEGGTADVEFSFGGEGPWEFTWIRSGLSGKGKKGSGEVLEMRSEVSEGERFTVKAGEEGVYEVVRVRDRWCEVRREGVEVGKKQKLLQNVAK